MSNGTDTIFNFVLGDFGHDYFSFLLKMLFSMLYLISAIFAEVLQCGKFVSLQYCIDLNQYMVLDTRFYIEFCMFYLVMINMKI